MKVGDRAFSQQEYNFQERSPEIRDKKVYIGKKKIIILIFRITLFTFQFPDKTLKN